MALTISEASAVCAVLKAVVRDDSPRLPLEGDVTERLTDALRLLDEKASRALQVSRIVPADELEAAARELVQRWADAVGGDV